VFLWVGFAALVLITAVVGWQVWGRYVLNDTPVWAEASSLLLVLYLSMLGAAVGVREEFHLGIVFVRDRLPPPWRRLVLALNHLLVGIFGAGMGWYGAELARSTLTHGIPTLGISQSVAYLPAPMPALQARRPDGTSPSLQQPVRAGADGRAGRLRARHLGPGDADL
jgi:TRAP-type C4-dicarboxylate transport system permease small subunit